MNQQTDTDTIPVHPAANAFPMLPDDQLQELAKAIKQNGCEPLKVQQGLLIDGRNRREACRIAGIEPAEQELDASIDPVEYILSANINRRHLTKGQCAMAVAMIYPEKQQGKKTSQLNWEVAGSEYLRMARTVLSVRRELAAQVRDGDMPLNDAYQKAQGAKQDAEQTERFIQILCEDVDAFGGEGTPVTAAIIDNGGLLSESAAKAKGRYERNKELWDNKPVLAHLTHNKIYNPHGGEMPDVAASALHDKGLIKDGYASTMFDAVERESRTARTIAREQRDQARLAVAAEKFAKIATLSEVQVFDEFLQRQGKEEVRLILAYLWETNMNNKRKTRHDG